MILYGFIIEGKFIVEEVLKVEVFIVDRIWRYIKLLKNF